MTMSGRNAENVTNALRNSWLEPSNDSLVVDSGEGSYEYGGGQHFMPAMDQLTITLQNIVQMLHLYYLPVAIFIGLISNTWCVVVFNDEKLKRLSVTVYLKALAVADNFHLIILLMNWLTIYDINYYHRGGWCQFMTFVRSLSAFLALWFIVSVTVDRFLACLKPAEAKEMCTVLRAKIVALGLLIVGIVVFLNVSLTRASILLPQGTHVCSPLPELSQTIVILDRMDVFVNFVLPYTTIMIMCFYILVTLIIKSRNRRLVTRNRGNDLHKDNVVEEEIHTHTKLVLVYDLVFLVLSAPGQAMRAASKLQTMLDPSSNMKIMILEQVFKFPHYTRLCLGLAIYLLANKEFPSANVRVFGRLAATLRGCCGRLCPCLTTSTSQPICNTNIECSNANSTDVTNATSPFLNKESVSTVKEL